MDLVGFDMDLIWVWFGFGMGLVWVWYGFGIGLVRAWYAVPPIEVRIGQTWSEFWLFWAKWSEKCPNSPPKVRICGWKQRVNPHDTKNCYIEGKLIVYMILVQTLLLAHFLSFDFRLMVKSYFLDLGQDFVSKCLVWYDLVSGVLMVWYGFV